MPVYIWVHGGGFVAGNGDLNGEYLSGNDTVVVSINYRYFSTAFSLFIWHLLFVFYNLLIIRRLGTLGFFATEALLNQSSTTGNRFMYFLSYLFLSFIHIIFSISY